MRYRHFISSAALALSLPASAVDVNVVGLFQNKAVVQINGGAARTISVGQKTAEGVTLLSVEKDSATLDIDGKRRTLKLGQQHASTSASSQAAVTLTADSRGHFVAQGQINGGAVRLIIDTGASLVSLSAPDAQRLGIDYRKGQMVMMNTANGTAPAWRVKLDSVRVGDISVDGVDAVVMETQAMPVLLGMSFLNRMDMRREGQILTLTKRF
jgi:aspartyl protease family protein